MRKIILILICLIPLASVKAQDEPTLQMDRTFNTSSGLKLDYNGTSGDLIINTWDKDEARIMVYANQNATENIEIKLVDGNGGINIKESSKYHSARNQNIQLKYEITLPSDYNININSSSSDYEINNLSGSVKVKTASGDGELVNVTGSINISSASGDLIIENVVGDVKFNSASGDISSGNLVGASDIKTASGDISLKYITDYAKISSTSGNVTYITGTSTPGASINTTSGDITIILSDDTQATIQYDTKNVKNGHTENDIFNGGGNVIECKTKSGEIIVETGGNY